MKKQIQELIEKLQNQLKREQVILDWVRDHGQAHDQGRTQGTIKTLKTVIKALKGFL